jgi:hypothetical protein
MVIVSVVCYVGVTAVQVSFYHHDYRFLVLWFISIYKYVIVVLIQLSFTH